MKQRLALEWEDIRKSGRWNKGWILNDKVLGKVGYEIKAGSWMRKVLGKVGGEINNNNNN